MSQTTTPCATCDGYQFIPVEGQKQLERCPYCYPILLLCPVHRHAVTLIGGVLKTLCGRCCAEERAAHRMLHRNRVALRAA